MTELEKKKKQVEILRVRAAQADMELNIAIRLDEIERLKENINNQEKRILEIQKELGG